jgi:serine/threonine protein kinase
MLHDPQFRSRFERELKIVAGLEHPAIVPVYDVGNEDGQPYFVMRYMNGGSLSNQIERGPFSLQDAARIISRIAEGLAYAHRKKIVHRDLKPDNILFDDNGDPFISDFGIAKLSEATGNLTGSGIIGTPAYMSPEQAQGDPIDSRSDVYGLGVIAYQMLSGERPYNADTPMGVAIKHITEPVPEILKVVPTLPVEVDAVIKNSMAKDREKRYPSTLDLSRNLNLTAFGQEAATLTPMTGSTRRFETPTLAPSTPRRRTGWIFAGTGRRYGYVHNRAHENRGACHVHNRAYKHGRPHIDRGSFRSVLPAGYLAGAGCGRAPDQYRLCAEGALYHGVHSIGCDF